MILKGFALQSTVLSIDPTFDLGDFYITVTTYRDLLLKISNGHHPVLMGPIFIHMVRISKLVCLIACGLQLGGRSHKLHTLSECTCQICIPVVLLHHKAHTHCCLIERKSVPFFQAKSDF